MRRMYLLVTLVLTLLSFLPASSAAAITMISPVGQPMIVKSPQGSIPIMQALTLMLTTETRSMPLRQAR